MGVQVAAQLAEQVVAAGGQVSPVLGLEPGQPLGHPAADRVGHHGGRARTHARDRGERPLLDVGSHVVGVQRQQRRGGPTERLDLVGVLATALEQEGDAAQRRDRPVVVRR